MKSNKHTKLEKYIFLQKTFVYLIFLFSVLTGLSALGYNYYKVKSDELKNKIAEVRKNLKLDYVRDKIVYARYYNNAKYNGNICVTFYDLTLINTGNSPLTLKSLAFKYIEEDKEFILPVYTLSHGMLFSKELKKDEPILKFISPNKIDTIIIVDFQNFLHKTAERLLKPDEAIQFGCTFIFETKDYNIIKNIKKTSLLVEDYLGNKFELSMNIPIPDDPILYILKSSISK
jgi:hypothetical protein